MFALIIYISRKTKIVKVKFKKKKSLQKRCQHKKLEK